jgi:4-carboxymuconolactone decarboxylase
LDFRGRSPRKSRRSPQKRKTQSEGVTTLSKQSNAAKQLIGTFAPKLVELTDRVLFDDVWERKELSQRDRSLITVAALITLNRPDQLRFHLGKALENGVKQQELIEVITHLAFYSGWPNAMSAIMIAKELFSKA